MDDKKIKESIDNYIGSKKLFTYEIREKIFSNTQRTSKPKGEFIMSMLRPILSFALLLVIVGGTVFYVSNEKETLQELTATSDQIVKENNELKISLEKAQEKIVEMNEQLELVTSEKTTSESLDLGSKMVLEHLGFTGTTEDIINELLLHPEIIPYEGILGGSVYFSESESKVISHEWIFAPFSDGHFVGHSLVKYLIKDNKPTDFEVIASYTY
jgi:hypothetical protein